MIALEIAREAAGASAAGLMRELEAAAIAMQEQRTAGVIAGGTVTGSLVEIKDVRRLVIAGDIHGDTRALFSLLDKIQYKRFLSDQLDKLVFLGDYVDRGSDSASVLYAVSKLKHTYPDSVILIRGNHEAPVEFPFGSHDLPYHLRDRFGSDAKAVYDRTLSLFQAMPLAVIIARSLLLVHGGLPTGQRVAEQFRGLVAGAQENHMHNRIMEELLWNDPRQLEGEQEWEVSPRGLGRHFGLAVTERWLAATGTKVIVRGHEPCQGYRIDHGGTVLTLFSTTEAYPSFAAAYITIDGDSLVSISNADALARHAKMLEL